MWRKLGLPLQNLTEEVQNTWGVIKPTIYAFLAFQVIFPMRYLAYSGIYTGMRHAIGLVDDANREKWVGEIFCGESTWTARGG